MHAVGIALLLAELAVQTRGELAAEDLVEHQQVGEIGMAARHPQMSGAEHGLGRAGTIPEPEPPAHAVRRHGDLGDRIGRLPPVGQELLQQTLQRVRIEVPGHDPRGAVGPVMSLVKRAHGLPVQPRNDPRDALHRDAVGMVAPEQHPQQTPVGQRLGAIPFGFQLGQRLARTRSNSVSGKDGWSKTSAASLQLSSRCGVRHCKLT